MEVNCGRTNLKPSRCRCWKAMTSSFVRLHPVTCAMDRARFHHDKKIFATRSSAVRLNRYVTTLALRFNSKRGYIVSKSPTNGKATRWATRLRFRDRYLENSSQAPASSIDWFQYVGRV